MMDRRWHWKTHKNCFLGFDLVNWLLANFQDVDSRDEAVDLGNQLMNQDVFAHVQGRHLFRDGNFFFRLKDDSEARAEPRNWFGMRMSDKSVPSTPVALRLHLQPRAWKARPLPRAVKVPNVK
jgi:hypothetical protein